MLRQRLSSPKRCHCCKDCSCCTLEALDCSRDVSICWCAHPYMHCQSSYTSQILLATIRIRQPAVSPALPLTPLTASNLSFDAVPTAVTAHSALLVQAIRTLLTALVDRPRSERMFEEVGGLADVADLLKSKNTSMDVRCAHMSIL